SARYGDPWQRTSVEKVEPLWTSCRAATKVGWELGRLPIVVPQQAAQMLATLDFSHVTADFLPRLDQSIVQPLVIAFFMIMADVRTDRPAQHGLAKENHPVQTLFAETSPESLQLGIEIGRMRRQANRLDSGLPENIAKSFTELGVPVHEEIALPHQEAVVGPGQIPCYLFHPKVVGAYRRAGEMDSASYQFHDHQEIESDQAVLGPNFDRREIDGSQHVPMRLEKGMPGRLAPPLGHWFHAMFFQDIGHACRGNLM